MSIVALTSDTLVASPGAGQIEYNGQFYGTDSNASRAQMQRLVQATSQASTSGTSIDFTSIPSWVKRITVMLAGVSSNGTSNFQVQIGAGSVDATSYTSVTSAGAGAYTSSTGFLLTGVISAALSRNGHCVLTLIGSNVWVASSVIANSDTTYTTSIGAGQKTLSGTLDRVRITTVNGTDTFDAGSINILYEG
jgi:hypothetical protein